MARKSSRSSRTTGNSSDKLPTTLDDKLPTAPAEDVTLGSANNQPTSASPACCIGKQDWGD